MTIGMHMRPTRAFFQTFFGLVVETSLGRMLGLVSSIYARGWCRTM